MCVCLGLGRRNLNIESCNCNWPLFPNSNCCSWMNLRLVAPTPLGMRRTMYCHFDLEKYLLNNFDKYHRCCC